MNAQAPQPLCRTHTSVQIRLSEQTNNYHPLGLLVAAWFASEPASYIGMEIAPKVYGIRYVQGAHLGTL